MSLTAARSSIFLSTPSARRATSFGIPPMLLGIHFYPRPPRGGRPLKAASRDVQSRFLSTPSARRATSLSTASVLWISISIHALREEGDFVVHCECSLDFDFYPRPPRGGRHMAFQKKAKATDFYPRPPRGGRPFSFSNRPVFSSFLSTPSARRATAIEGDKTYENVKFLSTPSARRATRSTGGRSTSPGYFYPRPPRGGRLLLFCTESYPLEISIHALREEGDPRPRSVLLLLLYFYPRPPRGGRQHSLLLLLQQIKFLSTPSARRATRFKRRQNVKLTIFLSTPSARRATSALWSS